MGVDNPRQKFKTKQSEAMKRVWAEKKAALSRGEIVAMPGKWKRKSGDRALEVIEEDGGA